jgi:OOP family OmpA-OmpF porin
LAPVKKLFIGLVALAALGVAGIHGEGGAKRIERRIADAVAASLAEYPWVAVKADGRRVGLAGTPPSGEAAAGAGATALALARRPIFGPVMEVEIAFAAPAPHPAVAPTEAPSEAIETPDEASPTKAETGEPASQSAPEAAEETPATAEPFRTPVLDQAPEAAEETPTATDATLASCEAELDRLRSAHSFRFEPGSDRLGAEDEAALRTAAAALADCPGVVVLEGHADSSGVEGANVDLSRRRAEAAAAILSAAGLDAARIRAEGLGASAPAATNATPEGRALNRRIEIRLESPPKETEE